MFNTEEIKQKREECIEHVQNFVGTLHDYNNHYDFEACEECKNNAIRLINDLPDIAIHLIDDIEYDIAPNIGEVSFDWVNNKGMYVAVLSAHRNKIKGIVLNPNKGMESIFIEDYYTEDSKNSILEAWTKLYVNPYYFNKTV